MHYVNNEKHFILNVADDILRYNSVKSEFQYLGVNNVRSAEPVYGDIWTINIHLYFLFLLNDNGRRFIN